MKSAFSVPLSSDKAKANLVDAALHASRSSRS